jgi:hypothetical protein
MNQLFNLNRMIYESEETLAQKRGEMAYLDSAYRNGSCPVFSAVLVLYCISPCQARLLGCLHVQNVVKPSLRRKVTNITLASHTQLGSARAGKSEPISL